MNWFFGRKQVLLPDDQAVLVDNLSTPQLRAMASYAGDVSASSLERLALLEQVKTAIYSEADSCWLVQNVSVIGLLQGSPLAPETSLDLWRPVV